MDGIGNILAPIKIDLESEGYRLRDVFVWNIKDAYLTPERFADITCKDFELPLYLFKPLITGAIKEQIQDFSYFITNEASLFELEEYKSINILIKLDITIENTNLVDRFEWSLGKNNQEPELMADIICSEMGLVPEFRSAISHAIREQIFLIKKLIVASEYSPQSSFIPPELIGIIVPKTADVYRNFNDLDNFTVQVAELTEVELEKLEQVRERESRLLKRQNRGKKYQEVSISFDNSPKVIRTPLSYRGSLHRVVEPADDDSESENKPTFSSRSTKRTRALSSIDSETRIGGGSGDLAQCMSCHALVPFNTLSKISNKVYCVPCREGLGLSSTALIFSKSLPSALARLGGPSLSVSTPTTTTTTRASKSLKKAPRQVLQPELLTPEEEALIPDWMRRARARLLSRYRNDFFSIVIDHEDDDEPKIKCYDCDRMYLYGPGSTLGNFEMHMRNKTHRLLVSKRVTEYRKNYAESNPEV